MNSLFNPINRKRNLILLGLNIFGGLSFGYNTGVIAGALGPMENVFDMNSLVQGITTTSILLGALIGSAFGGTIAEAIGKKNSTYLLSIFMIVGVLGISLVPWLWLLILFREVLGIGVGLSSVVCPTYCSEMAPSDLSGAINASFQLAITLGIAISYLVNIIFQEVWGDYHWMFIFGAIPALGTLVVAPFMNFVPLVADESKMKDPETSKDGALTVYKNMFLKAPWPVAIGIILAVALQFTGINAVMYYGPKIFASTGLGDGDSTDDSSSGSFNYIPLIATLIIGVWNFLTTIPALLLVERLGRRLLVLSGLSIITLSCLVLAIIFFFNSDGDNTTLSIMTILLLLLYILAFESSIGSLFWVIMTEIFPADYKDAGASFVNVLQWTFNIILSAVFPVFVDEFNQGAAFLVFFVFGIVCVIFLFLKLPETRNSKIDEEEYIPEI